MKVALSPLAIMQSYFSYMQCIYYLICCIANTSVLILLQAERKFEQKDISGARKEYEKLISWFIGATLWIGSFLGLILVPSIIVPILLT